MSFDIVIRRFIFALLLAVPLPSFACQYLSAAMDEVYGAGLWQMRTDAGTGTDIAPALEMAIEKYGAVCVDRGSWALKTSLSKNTLSGSLIKGVSSQSSRVYFQQQSGAAFSYSGSNGKTGGGLHGLAIILESGKGFSSAVAVRLEGDSLYQPDQMMFSDLYITALDNSYWFSGFYANGISRTSPKGIRAVGLNNIQVFKVHGLGVWLSNVVQWSINNIGVYVGVGAGQNLYLAGGGSYLTNSELVAIHAASISGQLNITNTTKFDISASCQSVATMTNASIGRLFTMGCPIVGTFGPGVSFVAN